MSAGPDAARAAFQVLQPGLAPSDQPHGWTLNQAVERLTDGAWSRYKLGDWREAAAYAVIQWIACEARLDGGDRGQALALSQIETIIKRLREVQRAGLSALD